MAGTMTTNNFSTVPTFFDRIVYSPAGLQCDFSLHLGGNWMAGAKLGRTLNNSLEDTK